MKRVLLTCAALLLTLWPVHATAADKWVEVRSPNFIVVSNAGEKEARRTAYELEQIRAILRLALNTTRLEGAPAVVFAIKDDKTLAKLLPAGQKQENFRFVAADVINPEQYYLAVRAIRSSGVFTTSIEAPRVRAVNPLTFQAYARRFVRLNFGALPLWLEMGLAGFYGGTVFQNDDIRLGAPDAALQSFLMRKRLIPLETLLRAERSEAEPQDLAQVLLFRAECWALTHYLTFGDDLPTRRPIREIVQHVRQGVDSRAALEQAVGDLKALQRKLEGYTRRDVFLTYPVPAPAPINLKDLPARDVSPAEVAALFGDYHLQDGRAAQARPYLEEALRLDPAMELAQVSMGWLHHQQGEQATAVALLEKAVAAHPGSYLAHYYLAKTLLDDPAKDIATVRRAEAALRRVVELQPGFAPAYGALAALLVERNGNLQEAARLVRKAVDMDPSVPSFYLTWSEVSLRFGQPQDAWQAAQLALAGAQNDAQRGEARTLISKARPTDVSAPAVVATTQPPAAREGERPQLKRRTSLDPRVQLDSLEGNIESVACQGFQMELVLALSGATHQLRSSNFLEVEFLESGKGLLDGFDPCKKLAGTRAKISFVLPSAENRKGEIVSVLIQR